MANLCFGLLMILISDLMMNEFDLTGQLVRSARYGILFEIDRTLI